ncbi:autophagy protein [Haplosporangium sp. Z 767]|nr:autophagy protein [Haplosporangium sp. Z 767]KAF9194310.1 autophagy protein [Haplosporangium sp. Z 11]
MNVSARGGELLFINFNQDFSCISVGTKHGFKIYNCDPFGKCYSKADSSIGIVEMLFCTSLVAIVGAGDQPVSSPRRLQIINTKRQSTICELTFPTTILSVKLNRKRLIVVLEDQIYVYDISNMKLLHTIETSPNPHAICALSPSSDNCFLAYPSPTPSPTSPFSNNGRDDSHGPSGDVLIFNALTLQVVNIVQAHKTSVSNISINSEGTMLATASDKGTVIRIWSIPNAQRLFQFRRGTQSARIYSLSFNLASTLLCVSSDTDTVHIFKLGGSSSGGGHRSNGGSFDGSSDKGSGMSSMIRRQSMHIGKNLAGSVGSYLPGAITEIFEPSRDFAHLKLPSAGVQSVIALSNTTPQVMVATSEGYLYQYNIDLENGGPCVLLKQLSLLESSDDVGANEKRAMNMQRQEQQQQQPQTPFYNSGLSGGRRMTGISNTMQSSQSGGTYSSNVGGGNLLSGGSGNGSGGGSGGSGRWSASSGFRQSINGGFRNSTLNSSLMSQRPSPMAPLTGGDEYTALSSSTMGPPLSSSTMGPPTNVSNRVSGFTPRLSLSGSGVPRPSLSGSVSMRDPRPVKDKGFQRALIHHIVNFLTQSGYSQAITAKNLIQPTNKDFHDLFKYLYLKLEPRYDFQRKLEDEVPVLMKTMRYPAADTISKTALYTVGAPHSWPYMLAMLAWMVDVIMVIEKHNEILEMQQLSNAHKRDREIDPDLDMAIVSPERCLYNYMTKTYYTWMLTGNQQDSEVEESLTKSFQNRLKNVENAANNQTAIIEARQQELEAARAEVSPLVALQKEQQLLKADIEKFKKAIEYTAPRIEEVRRANEDSRRNIVNKQAKLTDIERAKGEIQEIVRAQTMTRAELDTKLDDRNRLRRREESLKQQILELKEEKRALDKRLQDGEREAERKVKEYHVLAMKIGIIPLSGKHSGGQDLELRLDLDNAKSGSGKLYSMDTKTSAERAVSALRNQLTKEVNKTGDELVILKEELEHLEEQITDDTAELQAKEYQLSLTNKKHHEERDNAKAETLNRRSITESRDEAIKSMAVQVSQASAEADRLEQDIGAIERQATVNRDASNRQIKEVLEQLADMKRHAEEMVGLVREMAAKKLEDTLMQKRQFQEKFASEETEE